MYILSVLWVYLSHCIHCLYCYANFHLEKNIEKLQCESVSFFKKFNKTRHEATHN